MKTNKLNLFLSVILGIFILTGTGCKKKEPDSTPVPVPNHTDIKFLGHKGAGNNLYEDKYMEMTPNCFNEALLTMDGVEIDAQMSLDGTIWMYHNSQIDQDCYSGESEPSLYNMHDTAIENRMLCAPIAGGISLSDHIYKLSDLISIWNNKPGGFYMDIEIKQADLTQNIVTNAWGSMSNYLSIMADGFNTLFAVRNNPNQQIFFEVDDTTFCRKIRNNYPSMKFFLFRYGYTALEDYADDAIAEGYDGITENFVNSYVNTASVKAAQSRGLLIQLWTPYTQAELDSTFAMNPNYIQSDNMNAKKDLNVD